MTGQAEGAGRRNAVRVSAKAIIIQDNRLLTTRNVDREGEFYLLPGGGQEPGESLPAALQRECREEIGVEVEVGELLFVRDYIGRNHEFAALDADVHQVELMFACTLPAGQVPRPGTDPDARQAGLWHQVGVEWLDLDRLEEYRLYPRALLRALRLPAHRRPIYLGDVS
ncbi:MAG: NUDIX domain-containing protein [Bacillota bacterium]|nr:NUDIX domain-containing protein [Bacillota bacterium]